MKLTDLKLLVDCAHADSDGVLVGPGFSAAMKRLLRRKLIEENPNWLGLVRLTRAGSVLIEKILSDHP